MMVKTLTQKEYRQLQADAESEIVPELDVIMATHQIVVVEHGKDHFKVLKYPKTFSVIDEEEEKLGVVVSRAELENFIFLQEI